ncbi:hypothetical protein [Amycolatopsis suaedae]|uniref:Uncharacterized protein n=1 Tax=Amycolatopsis suaedae TaxID=2510978 RepID=A0A4Q7JC02_9PSEU|nr:hypothetical protein [Amycolatopsis suaedae]RZQ64827.1 hypothetical protein EWH70_08055 [Amycolatopsis suaedae]
MTSTVKLVDADGPFIEFRRSDARLVSSALSYVLSSVSTPATVELLLGSPAERVDRYRAKLTDAIEAAQRAYEARESREASKVRVPAQRAHLLYTALVVSTHMTRSEEEYNIQVGAFKENALDLADGIIAAFESPG